MLPHIAICSYLGFLIDFEAQCVVVGVMAFGVLLYHVARWAATCRPPTAPSSQPPAGELAALLADSRSEAGMFTSRKASVDPSLPRDLGEEFYKLQSSDAGDDLPAHFGLSTGLLAERLEAVRSREPSGAHAHTRRSGSLSGASPNVHSLASLSPSASEAAVESRHDFNAFNNASPDGSLKSSIEEGKRVHYGLGLVTRQHEQLTFKSVDAHARTSAFAHT
jgi:hypothetical protein